LHKGGIDYDEQNRQMADDNVKTRQAIFDSMVAWDNRLSMDALRGVDRGPQDDRPWHSGSVDILTP